LKKPFGYQELADALTRFFPDYSILLCPDAEKDQTIEQRRLDVEKQRSLENDDELDGPGFKM
jgi:hypothetical protein